LYRDLGGCGFDLAEVGGGEFDFDRVDVLLQAV
jgi:hypothetical protein